MPELKRYVLVVPGPVELASKALVEMGALQALLREACLDCGQIGRYT